jgi:hypothetical protein
MFDEDDVQNEDVESPAKVFLADRQRAYLVTFNGEFAKAVLADLEAFCRARQSTFRTDAREHALLEGRREVFLRLEDHLRLNLDELIAKYGGK